MRVASIFLLTLLHLFCKAQKQWDRSSLWLEEGEIIDVKIPAGSRQVRVLFKHEESQEWKVWQTSHIPDDANGSIYFRVPHDMQRSKVRFEWNGYDPLPYSFYTGKSNFSTRATDPGERNNFLARTELAADSLTEDESSEVEESDIWKLIGNTLYFFNQRRGLQILDLSNPTEPEFISRYRLPASGEQMYVSEDGEFIFLFVTPPHQAWPYHSNLQILQFEDETIRKINDIKLAGHYRDSRIIGETLHIVCEKWENEATSWNGWNFNYSSVFASFDLDNPKEVEKISEITLAGSPQVTYATNQHLVVVTRDPKDYYNPSTGESWTSETGGWTAPDGWIKGTREEYEENQKSNSRRSGSFNNWQELNTENIYVFETEEAPTFFDVNATKAWKYRPSTAIDLQVEELDGKWKNQTWFGNFYDLPFPWIYHTELQWLYFSESSEGSFWLWSKELGWIWTQASAFPYCFSNSNEGWLYLDLKDRNSLRYYDFKSEDWIKFD